MVFKSNRKLNYSTNKFLKLEAFHQSHTRIPSGNEASALKIFGNQRQTFPGNMPEGIMKDISTQRGEHMEHSKLIWEDVKFEEIRLWTTCL